MHEQAERIKCCTHSRKEIEACENIINAKNENEKRLSCRVKDLVSQCQEQKKEKNRFNDIIESRFSTLEAKLTTKIKETIDSKLSQTQTQTESKKSFAEVAKTNHLNLSNIKQLLRSEKVEEQIETKKRSHKRKYNHPWSR